jgi:hypothetical protein
MTQVAMMFPCASTLTPNRSDRRVRGPMMVRTGVGVPSAPGAKISIAFLAPSAT